MYEGENLMNLDIEERIKLNGHIVEQAVSRRLLTSKSQFDQSLFHVGFTVDKVARGQVSFIPSHVILIPQLLHTHISVTHHKGHAVSAVDSYYN
jgi:hypothetical protein